MKVEELTLGNAPRQTVLIESSTEFTDIGAILLYQQSGPRRRTSTVAMSAAPTVTKERVGQTIRQTYPDYKVIVLNDDFNTFQYVAETLVKYIPNMTPDQAWNLTNQVHYEGQATVWVGPLEQAELYHSQLIRAGLTMAPLEKA